MRRAPRNGTTLYSAGRELRLVFEAGGFAANQPMRTATISDLVLLPGVAECDRGMLGGRRPVIHVPRGAPFVDWWDGNPDGRLAGEIDAKGRSHLWLGAPT